MRTGSKRCEQELQAVGNELPTIAGRQNQILLFVVERGAQSFSHSHQRGGFQLLPAALLRRPGPAALLSPLCSGATSRDVHCGPLAPAQLPRRRIRFFQRQQSAERHQSRLGRFGRVRHLHPAPGPSQIPQSRHSTFPSKSQKSQKSQNPQKSQKSQKSRNS